MIPDNWRSQATAWRSGDAGPLDGVDLDGAVITADALHTQRATADYVHGRGADFILPVKDNQPGLFDALDALPWRDVPVACAATGRGHGRIETRTKTLMVMGVVNHATDGTLRMQVNPAGTA